MNIFQKLFMAEDFDAAWDEYMEAYESCDPQAFLDEMQEGIRQKNGRGCEVSVKCKILKEMGRCQRKKNRASACFIEKE